MRTRASAADRGVRPTKRAEASGALVGCPEELNVPEPKLSVILATDTYPTIRPVVDRLRRQTARGQIELMLVAPSAAAVSAVMAHRGDFADIRIVECPFDDLAPARAAGIRAAAAKFVFVGETHS